MTMTNDGKPNDNGQEIKAELMTLAAGLAAFYEIGNPVRTALDRLAADLQSGPRKAATTRHAHAALKHLGDPHSTAHRLINRMLAHKAG